MHTYVICVEQHNTSPAAAALIVCTNEAVCKLTAWDIHKKYNKHKTHPEGVIIHRNLLIIIFSVIPEYKLSIMGTNIQKWKLHFSLQGSFRE